MRERRWGWASVQLFLMRLLPFWGVEWVEKLRNREKGGRKRGRRAGGRRIRLSTRKSSSCRRTERYRQFGDRLEEHLGHGHLLDHLGRHLDHHRIHLGRLGHHRIRLKDKQDREMVSYVF